MTLPAAVARRLRRGPQPPQVRPLRSAKPPGSRLAASRPPALAVAVVLALVATVAGCGTRLPDEAFDAQRTSSAASETQADGAVAEGLEPGDPGTEGASATDDDTGTGSGSSAGAPTGSGSSAAGGGAARGPNQASDVGITPTTIRIGTIVAETGVLGSAFAPAVWGLRSWVAHTNAQGGIAGRTIELFTCDDREDRARTLECAKRLVEKDKVFALVAVNTRSIGGASLYLEEQGIPVLGFPISNAFNRFSHFYLRLRVAVPATARAWGSTTG